MFDHDKESKAAIPDQMLSKIFDRDELTSRRLYRYHQIRIENKVSEEKFLEGIRKELEAQKRLDEQYKNTTWRSHSLIQRVDESIAASLQKEEDDQKKFDQLRRDQKIACGTNAPLWNLQKEILVV